MVARSVRVALAAALAVVMAASATASCLLTAGMPHEMACCRGHRVEAGALTEAPACCQTAKPIPAQVAATRSLPDLKSLVAPGAALVPSELALAPVPFVRVAAHTQTSVSPPILQLTSALRL